MVLLHVEDVVLPYDLVQVHLEALRLVRHCLPIGKYVHLALLADVW